MRGAAPGGGFDGTVGAAAADSGPAVELLTESAHEVCVGFLGDGFVVASERFGSGVLDP